MPFSITQEPPSGMVLKLSGAVDSGVFVTAVQAVHTHESFAALRYIIDDLSEVTDFEVDATTVLQIFAESVGAGETNPNRRIYVVATHEKVVAYMAQFLGKYAGALPISRYDTVQQARLAIQRDLADAGQQIIRKA